MERTVKRLYGKIYMGAYSTPYYCVQFNGSEKREYVPCRDISIPNYIKIEFDRNFAVDEGLAKNETAGETAGASGLKGEPKDKKSAKNKVSTASRVLDFVKLESEEVIGGGGHDYVPRIKKSKVKQETWSPFKPLSPYKSTSKYSKSSPLLFDSDSDAYESSFINDDSPSEHSTPTTLEKLERRAAKKKKPKRVISETPTPKAAKGKGKIDFMDSDDELGIPSSSAAVARTPPVVPSIPVIELD